MHEGDNSDKKLTRTNNKFLIIILSVLGLIVVALTVSIIVVKLNPPVQEETSTENEEEEEEDYPLYWEGMSEEEFTESQLHELELNLHDQTMELLSRQPADVSAVNKLYDSAIAKALEEDRTDYIISYIDQRTEDYLSFGLTRAALDAMLTTDFSIFSEPDQYRLYTKVIELAEELNDTAVLSEYKALQKSVEAAYQADYNATAEAARRNAEAGYGYDDEEEEE